MISRIIMLMITGMTIQKNSESDCENYRKLRIEDVASIERSDLPPEFSDEAFKVVDEFIRKNQRFGL